MLRVEDPLQMLYTEQGDIALETQQDSDLSDEDIADTQDTQAAGGRGVKGKSKSRTREGQHVLEEKAEKRSKKPTVLFTAEEQKLVDILCDNEILKCLMDYKDRSKREAVWDKFCKVNYMDKDACQRWFQRQHSFFGKVTHMKSGQGEPQLTERQKLTRDNFDFLRDLQWAHHPDGRLCRWNRSRTLLAQIALMTQQTCPTWIHIPLLLDRVASV